MRNSVSQRSAASLMLSAGMGLMTLLLSGCFGCGGESFIRADLERGADQKQPAWVGIYYLSQESAIDAFEASDLVSRTRAEEKLAGVAGIVMKEINPVYPDEPVMILKEAPDASIRWIVIVANLKGGACARQKLPVKKGQTLKLKVTVEESCLVLKKD